jgi:nitroreductase
MTYMLAAAAHGLDTAPMEGFDADAVHKALGLPERYSVPLIVATGYAQVALTPNPNLGFNTQEHRRGLCAVPFTASCVCSFTHASEPLP